MLSPADVVTHIDYDNLGRTTWSKTYASADFTLSAGELRGQTNNLYDALGRVYESRVYEVDPDDGTVGDYLPSSTWYDARGYTVKTATANGLFQKQAYNGLGRLTASYTSFDTDETDYADADDVAGDTVIEQSQTWYNQAAQPVATAAYQRLPDDTSTTGALTGANSYATAAVVWVDGLGRTVATTDYGREDVDSGLAHYSSTAPQAQSSTPIRTASPTLPRSQPPAPNSSDNYLVALTQYNSAGRAYPPSTTSAGSPRPVRRRGRTVRTIRNYDDGSAAETDTDQDVIVDYQVRFSGGRLVTMTAYNAKGSGGGVQSPGDQVPLHLGSQRLTADGRRLSRQRRRPVGTAPPRSGRSPPTTATTSTGYDRLGRTTSTTDQRGVVTITRSTRPAAWRPTPPPASVPRGSSTARSAASAPVTTISAGSRRSPAT
ncbi:MAG: hypothetical protein M5R36_27165 [Deltaproteobacteria bacterium]|nr:hypothetical protein [Deltaproteobacteria bacterium]